MAQGLRIHIVLLEYSGSTEVPTHQVTLSVTLVPRDLGPPWAPHAQGADMHVGQTPI